MASSFFPFGVFRRWLAYPLWYANTCREPTVCALDPAQTIERDVRGFFSFFSCPNKKRTRFSLTKEKAMSFSHRRENDEKSKVKI